MPEPDLGVVVGCTARIVVVGPDGGDSSPSVGGGHSLLLFAGCGTLVMGARYQWL